MVQPTLPSKAKLMMSTPIRKFISPPYVTPDLSEPSAKRQLTTVQALPDKWKLENLVRCRCRCRGGAGSNTRLSFDSSGGIRSRRCGGYRHGFLLQKFRRVQQPSALQSA